MVFGIDIGGATRKEIEESLNLVTPGGAGHAENPLFVIADTFNRIVWYSTGYTIGIGDTILSIQSRIR